MKLLTQLLEAYTHYVQLPLSLINEQGTTQWTQLTKKPEQEQLLELATIGAHIQKAAIVSIPSVDEEQELYYIITPFCAPAEQRLLAAAGPFAHTQCLGDDVPLLNEQNIEALLLKMNELYDMLLIQQRAQSTISMSPPLFDVLQYLSDVRHRTSALHQMENIFNKLLQLEAFDFFCIALKNEDDVFVVQTVAGEAVQKLSGKSFYMGEGLLGKAAILNKDLYWTKEEGKPRIEFLHRQNIFPEHVFGTPIHDDDDAVIGMLFCGNFTHVTIHTYLRQLIPYMLRFITQRIHMERTLQHASYVENIFTSVLDLFDVLFNTSEIKLFTYKLLDFCQQMEPSISMLMTVETGEQLQRGTITTSQQVAHRKRIQRADTPVIEEREAHIHFEHYGYLSMYFSKTADVQQLLYILSLLQLFMKKEYVALQPNHLFEALHENMYEMNRAQYERTCIAVHMIEDIANTLKWTDTGYHLRNACYMLPYSVTYLQTHIRDTVEWQYIQQMHQLLQNKQTFTVYKAPVQVLAFLYKYVIQQQTHDVPFLSEELKDICLETYARRTIPQRSSTTLMGNDVDDVIEALSLTSREKDIVRLVVEGLNNQEVAAQLNISVHTVKNHVTNIFKKLNVSDRIQAMTKIYRMHLQ